MITSSQAFPPRLLADRVLLPCLLPMLLLTALLGLCAVDVLFWDEWMIWSKFLEKMPHGLPSLWDLIAQQNEQRNFAARFFGLLFMPVCGLNRFCEMGVTLLLTVGSWLCLYSLWQRTRPRLDLRGGAWLPVLFSLLLFSLVQWQVFTMGANTSIALTVFCLLLGAWLLDARRLEPWRLLLLVAVGWLGSFNFANGLFYWIVLAPLFGLAQESGKRRGVALALFLLAGALAWGVYFHDYVKPQHHPALTFSLSKPGHFIGFFLAYIAAPLGTDTNLTPLALLCGAGAFGLFLWLLLDFWRRERGLLLDLAPWLVFGVFALMSNGATTLGRAGLGVQHALESRYTTFGNLFWVCLLALWFVGRERLAWARSPRWMGRYLPVALCVFLLGSTLSAIVMYNRIERFEKARDELYSLLDDKALAGVFPDPNYLRKILPLFLKHRVGAFRDVGEFTDYEPAHFEFGEAGAVESVETIEPGGELPAGVIVMGLAHDPDGMTPARLVLFVSHGEVMSVARPDARGRFRVLLPSDHFPEGRDADRDFTAALMPLAVFADNKTAAPLEMSENPLHLPAPWYPPFTIDRYFYSE